jgi:hypothetical protein
MIYTCVGCQGKTPSNNEYTLKMKDGNVKQVLCGVWRGRISGEDDVLVSVQSGSKI